MVRKNPLLFVFAALMVLLPVGGIFIEGIPAQQTPVIAEPRESPDYTSNLKVYDQADGKVKVITPMEYVAGAVALEMPVTFEPQALAAQAVAAHTYARYCQMFNAQYPNNDLKGADFAVDTKNAIGYLPKEKVKEMYKDRFEESWEIITKAAEVGVKNVIEYEGKPILAAYHATSAGSTEAAQNVWNSGFDYLVPVSSPGDLMAKGYRASMEFRPAELKDLLQKNFPKAKLSADYKQWIKPLTYSDSGYITAVEVGGVSVQGKELRTALGLRSTNFTVSYQEEKIVITTLGYGHGVGLSQNGANYMATQGADFVEILSHYYPKTDIIQLIS